MNVAVVGGGPVGAATAHALASQHGKRVRAVHWFEANRPLAGDFSRLSMSCPWAAGQILVQSFEPDSFPKRLGMRTLEVLHALAASGRIPMQPRPWLACARKGDDPADVVTREVLDSLWREGRMESCTRIHGDAIRRFHGLLHNAIEFALCDEHALAVDPRALAVALAQWAAGTPGVVAHFGAKVTGIDAGVVHAIMDEGEAHVPVDAVVLCVGVHGSQEAGPGGMLHLEGTPLSAWIPRASVTHLHVFDHRDAAHQPVVNCSVAGAATIARYEVFGAGRHGITPHLPEAVRAQDVNPLLTDVPGLCRMLDTHFASLDEALCHGDSSREVIAGELRKLIDPAMLPGEPGGRRAITESVIASYVKHEQPEGEPVLRWLDTVMPALYVQPTNGRGVTQCIGLGEEAGKQVTARTMA